MAGEHPEAVGFVPDQVHSPQPKYGIRTRFGAVALAAASLLTLGQAVQSQDSTADNEAIENATEPNIPQEGGDVMSLVVGQSVTAVKVKETLDAIAFVAAISQQAEQQESQQPSKPTQAGTPIPNSGGETGSEFLECTKAIESDSSGGYSAVSPDGQYRGAYQFDQETWDSTAAQNGRGDLVGQDPATVSPTDQDDMALDLYERRGNAPWNGRC